MAYSLIQELKRRNVFKATTAYLVLAWVVIQVTSEAVPALGLPDWVNTLVFLLGALGLPFVILFSWAFELTPEGIKKDAEVAQSDSITSVTAQKLNYVIIGLLVVAIGLMLFDRTPSSGEQQAPIISSSAEADSATNIASIAVLPFMNMSNDPEQEFFSDGITEELLNVLAKIDTFEVASRTSSFKFKGSKDKIPDIAKDLNVRYVVEGSVRRAGQTIRITAQLIDSSNDRHLWSDTYDRPLTVDNVFIIQDEISQNIVSALSKELGLDEVITVQTTHTTDNLSAYELYLQARAIQTTRLNLDDVTRLLDLALEQDPDYADALALAAVNYALLAVYGTELPLTRQELSDKSVEYANKAISLNDNSANAYAVLGFNLHLLSMSGTKIQWSKGFEYYKKAIALNPKNPQALNWLAAGKMTLGYLNETRELLLQCISAEPTYSSCHANLMFVEAALGDDSAAIKRLETVLNMGGLDIVDYAPILSFVRLDMPLAFKTYSASETAFKGWSGHDDLFQALKTPEQDHSQLLAELLDYSDSYMTGRTTMFRDYPLLQSLIMISLGFHDTFLSQFNWEPALKRYRQSETFKSNLINMGALNYWREYGFPEQCRPLGEDDFVCD
jgi:TolB-like protein